MFEFIKCLKLSSAFKYVVWRALGRRYSVALELRSGGTFELRGSSNRAGGDHNNDLGVAWEVFTTEVYRRTYAISPPPGKSMYIVDIGSNVGMSLVLWLNRFPNAIITAFEPHPSHRAQIRRNVELNRGVDRVEVIEAGAGSTDRTIFLSDRGASSCEIKTGQGIETRVVDIFEKLSEKRIDLMKIDAEGAEFELLSDRRMASLDVRALIVEWHKKSIDCGEPECIKYLVDSGFHVSVLESHEKNGMLWATKIGLV
jgi:FkbM family methyltransferase